jgi:hypothetical protein
MGKVVIIFSLVIISLLVSVQAITGSIGNARMILRLDTGEQVEKYVLVKNVNDVPLDIEITVSGDLENSTEIKDKEFRLEPGEEKEAHFTIKALERGTTGTKINVVFSPEQGSGVGLSSTVIVIARGESVEEETTEESKNSILDWFKKDNNETEEPVAEPVDEETNTPTGAAVGISPVSLGLLSTTVILVIFMVLLVIYSQKKSKIKVQKRVRKK